MSRVAEVQSLYGRYKHLALAAGAALVLDAPLEGLEADTAELLADARCAAAAGGRYTAQLAACVAAASELHTLIAEGGDVDAARRTHRQLRREVWKVIPCEYVPCCAGHANE